MKGADEINSERTTPVLNIIAFYTYHSIIFEIFIPNQIAFASHFHMLIGLLKNFFIKYLLEQKHKQKKQKIFRLLSYVKSTYLLNFTKRKKLPKETTLNISLILQLSLLYFNLPMPSKENHILNIIIITYVNAINMAQRKSKRGLIIKHVTWGKHDNLGIFIPASSLSYFHADIVYPTINKFTIN